MVTINAENQVLGRLAGFAARYAMKGEKVNIINSEKAIITGKRSQVLLHYKNKVSRGVPRKGPYFPRQPDRLIKRTIRGMLPYKKKRGEEAFKRVLCYNGTPKELEKEKTVPIPNADVSKLSNLRYVSVGEVCKELSGFTTEPKTVASAPEQKKAEQPKPAAEQTETKKEAKQEEQKPAAEEKPAPSAEDKKEEEPKVEEKPADAGEKKEEEKPAEPEKKETEEK